MKILSKFRRYVSFACSLVGLLGLATPAFATHLRGGTVTWRVTSATPNNYTVQFTFTESSRWSYPGTAGSCGTSSQTAGTCPALNSSVDLSTQVGGSFAFGDGASFDPTGTVTSINQAEDYYSATFIFSHTYNISAQPETAFYTAGDRISTLKIGHDEPEYISTIVRNYTNGAPTAATPAILALLLQPTITFNIAGVVTDIDPNATLVYRLATLAEQYGPGTTSEPCPSPSKVSYPNPGPPGFTVSSAGQVTWDTTQIATSITGGNCKFGIPAAGDLWTAQIMVEAHDKTSGILLTQTPVDLLMKFVNSVGTLPTITLDPAGTQTVAIGTPTAFTATGTSNNAGAKVTLNASGIPSGATATGLNAAVTPPTTSNFNWTPGPGQDGTYVVTYTVTDDNLQQATASNTIVVATLPTISCAAPQNATSGQIVTLTSTVFDINQDLLNVVWSVDGTTVQTNSNVIAYPNPATVPLQQTFGSAGVHPVKVTATDPHGVAVSCSTSVTAYQRTSLAVAPASTTAGAAVLLSAFLMSVPGEGSVPNQTVTFSFSGPGAPSPQTTTTDINGVAALLMVFPTPGVFTATATFSNPGSFFTDSAGDIPPVPTTGNATVTVSIGTTSLSGLSAPSTALAGVSLTVTASLNRTSPPVDGVPGATIIFKLTAPDSTVTTANATTDVNGNASATFAPTTNGVFSVSASFAGTTALAAATSSSASVTVYQRTSLALPSATGAAGSTLTLNATLTAIPGGAPLANQTVTFNFSGTGAPSPTTAVTNANGVATALVLFPTAGVFTDTASFFNPSGFFEDANGDLIADTVVAPVTVALATTSLSALTAPSVALLGGTMTASTTLNRISAPSGPVTSVPIVFTLTAPGGAVTTVIGTTDTNGLASATFTPTVVGMYTVSAQFAGTSALQAATSSTASVTVYQRTSLALSSASGTAGSTLTLSATLTAVPSGVPVANQTVTFTFSGTGAPSPVTATTNASGVATVPVVFPTAGTFTATASFSNPGGFFADSNGNLVATTVTATVTVGLATTSLSALSTPVAALVGNSLTVSTTLSQTSAPAGPLADVPIVFTFTAPGGAMTTVIGTTSANGLASASYTPPVGGAYSISAQFAGTPGLASASSSSASVTVYQRTSLAMPSTLSGNAGRPLTLSASLTTLPGGVPLANQTVTFNFSGTGAPSPVMTVTDANGVATASVLFPAAGSFTVTASFSNAVGFFTDTTGDVPPAATVSTEQVTVSNATTSLSALSVPSAALLGGTMTVSTTLNRITAPSGPLQGQAIGFTLTAPGGAVTQMSGTTDANGLATATFMPTVVGVYSISASFAATAGLLSATPPSAASVTVYQRTSLAVSSASGTGGNTLTVSATLTAVPSGVPVANQSVTFSFSGTGAPSPVTAVTNGNGVATAPVVFPAAGSFTATASFSNPGGFFTDAFGDVPPVADTATAQVTVGLATTSLSALSTPVAALVGNSLTVSATLSQTSAPAGPLANVPIVFTFTAPGGAMTTVTGTTSANGLTSASYTPPIGGAYTISAQFAGTAGLASASSSTASVTVYQRTSLSLSSVSGTAGSTLTVNATLTTFPGGVPLANQTVTFNFSGTGAPNPVTAATNGNGVATVSVVFPTAGTFTATASFSNAVGFFTDTTGDIPPAATVSTAQVTVAPAPQATITVTASGLVYSRVSQTYTGTVTLKNTGGSSVSGPFQILFTGLTANVTLVNATGTLAGAPYITVSAPASLAPGQSAVVNVQFADPSNATIHFTPLVQEGTIVHVL